MPAKKKLILKNNKKLLILPWLGVAFRYAEHGDKNTMRHDVIEQNFNIDETTGLRTDKTVELSLAKSKRLYPEKLRLVEFYDKTNDELLVFLTNNFEVSALEVARPYRQRWQVEVFSNG